MDIKTEYSGKGSFVIFKYKGTFHWTDFSDNGEFVDSFNRQTAALKSDSRGNYELIATYHGIDLTKVSQIVMDEVQEAKKLEEEREKWERDNVGDTLKNSLEKALCVN